jgi:hypothetical protein
MQYQHEEESHFMNFEQHFMIFTVFCEGVKGVKGRIGEWGNGRRVVHLAE